VNQIETIERMRRIRVPVMLIAATLVAGLLAFMWWNVQPAEATTDPGKIVFVSDRNATFGNFRDIYIMNPDGSDVQRVANRPGNEFSPVLSPDGSKIAFVAGDFVGPNDIYVMNLDGSGQVNLTNSPTRKENPSWSPDGSKVAFMGVGQGGTQDIFTANADGSGQQVNVTDTSSSNENAPSWSPDGQKFAFTDINPTNNTNDIYTINADGSGRVNLTNTSGVYEFGPSWSPDSQKIAYERILTLGGTYDIYTMNADGSAQSPIANSTTAEELGPSWSPDGTQLVYTHFGRFPFGGCCTDGEIFRVNYDGTDRTQLTNNVFQDIQGKWGVSMSSDINPPVLALPDNITEEATGSDGAEVTFAVSAEDEEDGPVPVHCASASGLTSGDTFPLGTTTVTCTAEDAAGNMATGSFDVHVVYGWSGVLQPVNADGSSIFKLGSTVPVKFALSGDSAAITDATAKLTFTKIENGIEGTVMEATSTATATTGNLFRYDAASGQYVFNWSTKVLESGSGTYKLSIDFGDGTADDPQTKNHVVVSLK